MLVARAACDAVWELLRPASSNLPSAAFLPPVQILAMKVYIDGQAKMMVVEAKVAHASGLYGSGTCH